jgi:hypothetical protein
MMKMKKETSHLMTKKMILRRLTLSPQSHKAMAAASVVVAIGIGFVDPVLDSSFLLEFGDNKYKADPETRWTSC